MGLEIGQVIDDKYRITKLIGEGGMGAVYAGENVRIKRRVAIKVLHAATASDAEAVARFEREAQAAGCIGNDHILEVLDLGSLPDGARYMVMEFLDGEALGDRIERCGQLTPAQIHPIARQTLEALRAAHDAGIIHRDLKPDNIFILHEKTGQPDYVKLIDFGISKFSPLGGDAVTRMTRTGAIMGTPYYMAPEQANGSRPADPRSDLYAIGVILYEAVTGKVPFEAETVNELLFKIVLSAPAPPQEWAPDLDAAFGSIVLKAMAREAEDRFQTAAEFLAALDAWANDGKAVEVPILQDGKATMIAKLEAAAKTSKGKTNQSWASTGPEQAPLPTDSGRRMRTTLSVAVALTLGGLGLGGYLLLRPESAPIVAVSEPPTAATAPSAAPNLPAAIPPVEPAIAPVDSATVTLSASAAPAVTTTPSAAPTTAALPPSAAATASPKPAIRAATPSTKSTATPPAAPTTKPMVDLGY